jgi:hypothetical protein
MKKLVDHKFMWWLAGTITVLTPIISVSNGTIIPIASYFGVQTLWSILETLFKPTVV